MTSVVSYTTISWDTCANAGAATAMESRSTTYLGCIALHSVVVTIMTPDKHVFFKDATMRLKTAMTHARTVFRTLPTAVDMLAMGAFENLDTTALISARTQRFALYKDVAT